MSGTVTNEQGQPVDGVQVQVINRGTGARTGTLTKEDGRYYVQGLEVGRPYTVSVRRIGFAPQDRNDLAISLGQNLRIDFVLAAQAATLEAITATAAADNAVINRSHTGVGTTVTDTVISRLPSLNRDFTDFAKLTPQVSTAANGLSGGGVNNRFNNIQIDGSSNADLFGLSSTPTPGGLSSAKTISIDAVKEYQVLLSPFDVRQGAFTGLLVNAVTKSGTNDFTGSAFYYFRDSALTREQPYLTAFKQKQYGFSLGGPIMRDKAFFFVNGEWQDQTQPSSGPFVSGGVPSSDSPVNQSLIDSFNAALAPYGIDGGTGEALVRKTPNTNWFARLDFNLPLNSRLAIRHNYAFADAVSFSRSASGATPTFYLTSNYNGITNKTNSTVAQLFTNLSNGIFNELLVSRTLIRDFRTVPVVTPEVTVTVPKPAPLTGNANLVAGTERSSQGNELAQDIVEITDNLTVPWGNHSITIGTRNQFYYTDNLFAQNRFGQWLFANIDSLKNGSPSSLIVNVPVGCPPEGCDGRSRFKAGTWGGYIQDTWQATRDLTVNAGVRVDVPFFKDKPISNPNLLAEIGRNTSDIPTGQAQFSPRLGFNWDATGDQANQVRGGLGLFTGPPAYVWLSNAFGNTGVYGFAQITCNGTTATATNRPPKFDATTSKAATPPKVCGGGLGPALGANVNLVSDDFRFPQDFKASFGYDHRFRKGVLDGFIGTLEGMYSRAVYSPFYENIALATPLETARDRNGRVMYGAVSAAGSTPTLITTTSRQQILDMKNSSKDYSYNISGTLSKRFQNGFEGLLAYTYTQARDVQSLLNSTAGSNWGQGRDIKGYFTDHALARSKWEQPHRVIASGTYTFPSRTDVSLFYEGRNGSPYDYVYTGSGTLGDLNGDGRAGNDLIYVPKDVRDPNEILFTGFNVPAQATTVLAMQNAFDRFINEVDCLRNQRGLIMDRNTCRNPWINEWNVNIRQNVRALRGQNATISLDIFNFGNLLNKNWGVQRSALSGGLAGAFLLTRTGQVADANGKPQGLYTFDVNTAKYSYRTIGSNYKMQLSVRYQF
jgi:hypothetical protein